MTKQACSICSASSAVVQAINNALKRKMPLRDLAEKSGFSRASLSRHSRRCIVRSVLAEHRERKKIAGDLRNYQIVVTGLYPGQPDPLPDPNDTRPIIELHIVYSKAPVKNPSALKKPPEPPPEIPGTEIPADIESKPLN